MHNNPVVLVTDSTHLGGAEIYLLQITKELHKNHIPLHLLTSDNGHLLQAFSPYLQSTTFTQFPYPSKLFSWHKIFPFLLKNYQLLKKIKGNVTYLVNDVYPNWAVSLLKKCFNIKIISLWQGEYVFTDNTCAKKWLKYGANTSDKLVASAPVADHLNQTNLLNKPVVSLNPRSDFARFNPTIYNKNLLRQQLGFSPQDNIAICVGQVGPRKGQEWLVEHFIANNTLNNNWKLLIVGPITPSSQEKWDTLKNSISPQKLFVLGPRSDIPELYTISDLALFPGTVSESFGLAVIEAALMQKPILALNSGAIPFTLGKTFPGLHNNKNPISLISHWQSLSPSTLHPLIPSLSPSLTNNNWSEKILKLFEY